MTPFVLKGSKELPPEPPPLRHHSYDHDAQLWMNTESGLPLITELTTAPRASQLGETTITETREGVDQPEISMLASEYGETTMTKTSEGVDQSEGSQLLSSPLGETTYTRTREGVDQSE